MTKTVALLVGGWSAERQVSLDKGRAVARALRTGGYDVTVIDVKKDIPALIAALTPAPDVVFNNLYGRGGEDGAIQALLEMLEIPYTHSGVVASAVGMDKPLAKTIAASAGLHVPQGCVMERADVIAGKFAGGHPLPPPYVVKPVNEGSSVGIRIVGEDEPALPFDDDTWLYGETALAESYIPGRELTTAVLDGAAQGVTEIVSQTRFFDYEAKYLDTGTDYILPAVLPDDVYNACLRGAERVYNALGCSGLARCDFRFDDSRPGPEGLLFLEINTQPGLTAESIGPSQVIRNGMSFVALCSHLVETAKCHGLDQKEPAKNPAEKNRKRQYA